MARVNWLKKAGSGLSGALRMHFGLSHAEAGALLGTSASRVNDAEAGTRLLPLAASRRLRALAPLLHVPPGPLPPSDWEPVRLRLAQCRAQADVLRVRLTYEVPARAGAAAARLHAADSLPAALTSTEAAAPLTLAQRQGQTGQLLLLQAGAAMEWDSHSGPAPAALLAARHAGLLAEAAALAQALPPAIVYTSRSDLRKRK